MPEKTKQNKKYRFPPTASTYPEGHSKLVLMIRLCVIDMYNSFKLRALCVTGKSKVAIKIHLCKSFTHTHTSAHTCARAHTHTCCCLSPVCGTFSTFCQNNTVSEESQPLINVLINNNSFFCILKIFLLKCIT